MPTPSPTKRSWFVFRSMDSLLLKLPSHRYASFLHFKQTLERESAVSKIRVWRAHFLLFFSFFFFIVRVFQKWTGPKISVYPLLSQNIFRKDQGVLPPFALQLTPTFLYLQQIFVFWNLEHQGACPEQSLRCHWHCGIKVSSQQVGVCACGRELGDALHQEEKAPD